MKIFLSYRFTGENPKILKKELDLIEAALSQKHKVWNSFKYEKMFLENRFTHRQILRYAFKNIDKSNTILAFVKSNKKSEGMLLEVGYALAKNKKFILAIRKNIKTTFLKQLADKVIEFNKISELSRLLKSLKK